MSAGLLCLASALLLWAPGRRPMAHRRDAAGSTGGRPATGMQLAARQLSRPLAAGCVAAGAVAAVSTILVALLAGVGAGLAARAWAARRREATVQAALLSLAEALGALAAELRSGRPLEAAAKTAAAACGDADSGRALLITARLASTGEREVRPPPGVDGPLADALARIAGAVRLSSRTGCSLAAVLAAVEDDLRARHRAARELRSATAGSRASAGLLAGLPVLGLAMGSGVGADPWSVLTATGPGQVLLVVGAALECAGVAWSHRLVRRALATGPVPKPRR